MDAFRSMQVFVHAVQQGSLSAAARQLGLSPAAVSRQMVALENSLGARLLNRTSRKLTLTEAGETYFQHAEQILHHFDEAQHSVSQLQRSPRGTLRIHSRILVGQLYIVPALTRFLVQYPEIKADLLLSNRAIDLVEQNIDVDIRIGALSDSSLIARKLVTSDRVVCGSPAYVAGHTRIEKPADLAQHNCLTYRLDMGSVQWRFMDPQGAVSDVPVSGSLQTDYGPALRAAAIGGLGLSLLPDWSVDEDLRQGTLVNVFPGYKVSSWSSTTASMRCTSAAATCRRR
ncbi:MAG: Transcriptional regulator, LysR family [Rhodoferax sp.]|nr:Transcriptional regulator, LysR family [Rhodoferax sp.]